MGVVDYLILLLKDRPVEEEPRAYTSCYGKLQASLFEMKHALSKKRNAKDVASIGTVWQLASQIAIDAALTADAYEKVYERIVKMQKGESNEIFP